MQSIEEKIKDWSQLHFVTYLYICVGKSDYSLVDEEIEEIFEKLSETNPDEDSIKSAYAEVNKVYNLQSDTEIINFIKRHSSKFVKSEDEKKKILINLEDIMEADGIIKDVEMIMYRFIKKILT